MSRKKPTKNENSSSLPAKREYIQDRNLEDDLVGSVDWRWRKFALGIMNGKMNYVAYNEAYKIGDVENDGRAYQVACAAASQLLRNIRFRGYWRELIVESGFNDDVADSRLVDIMTNPNTPPKDVLKAVELFKKLGGKIVDRTDVTTKGKIINNNPFPDLTAEELRKLAQGG